jgi:hypothetical protein
LNRHRIVEKHRILFAILLNRHRHRLQR